MSLRNDKKDIFTTIGAYTSLGNEPDLPDLGDTYSSLNENTEPFHFLVETIKSLVGEEGLKLLIGELFTNLLDEIQPQLKQGLVNQLIDFNEGDVIPDCFKNIGGGINIPIQDIDVFSKLKTDPNSDIGGLLYGEGVDDFDSKAYEAIVADGTDVVYGEIIMRYDSITDSLNFRSKSDTISIGDWFTDFISGATIIKKDELISRIFNSIFGVITSKQNKSLEKIYEEKILDKKIEKIIGESFENEINNENLLLNENELISLYDEAKDLKNGKIRYNLGCDCIFEEIQPEETKEIINEILTSVSPNNVGNIMENVVLNKTTGDSELISENKSTIVDSFFQKTIRILKHELIKSITLSPQILTLISISKTIKNDCTYETINKDDLIKENRVFIKCITRSASNEINRFVFNVAIMFLTRLVRPVVSKIIKEKINQYIRILKSLVSI